MIFIFNISSRFAGVIDHEGGSGLPWDACAFGMKLSDALKDFLGYPNAQDAKCSAFLQDKFEYIRSLPEFSIPTLVLERTVDGELPEGERRKIFRLAIICNCYSKFIDRVLIFINSNILN